MWVIHISHVVGDMWVIPHMTSYVFATRLSRATQCWDSRSPWNHDMGWLRFVGSVYDAPHSVYTAVSQSLVTVLRQSINITHTRPPVYPSPSVYRLFYRALLQKRPVILRSLLIVATSCDFTTPYHAPPSVETVYQYHTHSPPIYPSPSVYRLFYRALLQKRPWILRSLWIEATP